MTFHLEEWLPVNDFIDFINSNKFPEVGYGDIYLKANFVNKF